MIKNDFDWEKIGKFQIKGPMKGIQEKITSIEALKEESWDIWDEHGQGILLSNESGDLSRWESSMTDPKTHGETFRYLVHAVHNDNSVTRIMQKALLCQEFHRDQRIENNNINLLQNPEQIAQKPLISASLIDENRTATWAPGGYILQVPLDNILQTASQDIGTFFWNGQDTVQKLYADRDLLGIADPDRVLRKTDVFSAMSYNEVVLTGTSRTGKEVKVQGVFAKVLPNGEYVNVGLSSTLSRVAAFSDLPFVRIQEPFSPYQEEGLNLKEDFFAVTVQGVRYLFIPAEQKFQVLEYGGLKSSFMTPEQRQFALSKARLFLQSSPHNKLEQMIRAAETVPDEVLLERERIQRRFLEGTEEYFLQSKFRKEYIDYACERYSKRFTFSKKG